MIRLFQLLCIWGCALGSDVVRGQPSQKLPPQLLRDDLRQMQMVLQTWHPGYAQYNAIDALNRHFDTVRQRLNQPMTILEFQRVARVAVAGVQCLHTSVSLPSAYRKTQTMPGAYFPMVVTVTSDDQLVRRGSSDLISEINGRPAKVIIDSLRSLFGSDGPNDSFKQWVLNRQFGTLYASRFGMVDTVQIRIKTPDGREEFQRIATQNMPEIQPAYLSDEPHSIIQTSPSFTLYRLTSHPKVAVLQLRSVGELLDRFRLKRALRYVRKQAIQHVVLDLRNNTGGRIWNATSLLRNVLTEPTALTFERYKKPDGKAPFTNSNALIRWIYNTQLALKTSVGRDAGRVRYNYAIRPVKNVFGGKITVLINGGTASAASLIAAYLREQHRATFVGEETGGSRFVSAGLMVPTVKLKYSQLQLKVPLFQVIHASKTANDGRGVKPDVAVEEWQSEKDAIMSKALELVNQ